MSPEEFRRAGHELIDWIADYRERIESLPVRAQVAPGEVNSLMPDTPPETPLEFAALLYELERVVVPGITQVQHPMHFGWFPSNASLSSVLGDFACAGLGTLGISWESCPALTEVEEAVCDWMRQLAGLSEEWRGTIHDTASTACLTAMLAARERASGYSEFDGGLQACDRPLVVYASDQAHSSVVKAVLLAGFGYDNLRLLPSDPATRALPAETLARAMADDVAAGRQPAAVIASLGTTGVTAFDPVGALVEAAAAHGAWVHADAAMAGSALLLPECRLDFLEPAQVDRHDPGHLAVLRARPADAGPRDVHQPGLPAVGRGRPGHAVPRLGYPAGPPLPRFEAVVPTGARRAGRDPRPPAPRPRQRALAGGPGRGDTRLDTGVSPDPADRLPAPRTARSRGRRARPAY
jgi:hypothetical protein